MTRWTRANNAHKKQPSNPTSWKELSDQKQTSRRRTRGSNNDAWRQTRRNNSKELRQQRRRIKTCFKCRQSGHTISECPSISTKNSGFGICFRCGSTEHKSNSCPVKQTQGQPEYPFALCFVCGEKGHLSSTCKQNEAGIYPKGGCCHSCGSVRHLKRDCPTLTSIEKEEEIDQSVIKRIIPKENVEDELIEKEPTKTPQKKTKTIIFK